jgi:hypothetical protein
MSESKERDETLFLLECKEAGCKFTASCYPGDFSEPEKAKNKVRGFMAHHWLDNHHPKEYKETVRRREEIVRKHNEAIENIK